MVKIIDEITLDLSKDELQGWERWKDAETIGRYIEKNIKGEKLPLIEVVKINGVYQIVQSGRGYMESDSYNYGGYYRAVSHYISRNNLDCLLLSNHRKFPSFNYFPIQNTHLYNFGTKENRNFLRKVSNDIFYKFINMCRYHKPKGYMNNELKDNFFRKNVFQI